mmetsp:Transcript_15581/g.22206  ORF Transcript_15581/g.22206 Transcript_15581/m.22206 type:complete len:95 (-) Transcript_15581:55-339(-)
MRTALVAADLRPIKQKEVKTPHLGLPREVKQAPMNGKQLCWSYKKPCPNSRIHPLFTKQESKRCFVVVTESKNIGRTLAHMLEFVNRVRKMYLK